MGRVIAILTLATLVAGGCTRRAAAVYAVAGGSVAVIGITADRAAQAEDPSEYTGSFLAPTLVISGTLLVMALGALVVSAARPAPPAAPAPLHTRRTPGP